MNLTHFAKSLSLFLILFFSGSFYSANSAEKKNPCAKIKELAESRNVTTFDTNVPGLRLSLERIAFHLKSPRFMAGLIVPQGLGPVRRFSSQHMDIQLQSTADSVDFTYHISNVSQKNIYSYVRVFINLNPKPALYVMLSPKSEVNESSFIREAHLTSTSNQTTLRFRENDSHLEREIILNTIRGNVELIDRTANSLLILY
ncbi:MAG: hypothetical protein JWQ35_2116 [Bacteriovoracaceae bacterium]|nr:hypothetical protein [Bacteriovoracaceae bacterium]